MAELLLQVKGDASEGAKEGTEIIGKEGDIVADADVDHAIVKIRGLVELLSSSDLDAAHLTRDAHGGLHSNHFRENPMHRDGL
jgi:hypothetical protein